MLHRAIILALLLWAGCGSRINAAETSDPAGTMQTVMASLRAAASYARTGNLALAQVELGDAKGAWDGWLGSFSDRPAPYPSSAWQSLLIAGKDNLARANDALHAGDGSGATSEILALRRSIRELRREAGRFELNDCVFDLAAPMEQLRSAAVRFGEAKAGAEEVKAVGVALRDHLQRCNGLASPEIASEAEFRRLMDGAISSAGEIGSAAAAGDAGLVHRYQIELQSFVNLLDFRFG